MAKNIIWGGLYIDADGIIEGVNHKTGERVELHFFQKTNKTEIGKIHGKGYDAKGRCVVEIEGSWLKEIRLIDLVSNDTEVLWKEIPMIPDAHL